MTDRYDEKDWYNKFNRQTGIESLAHIPQREGYYRKGVITNYPASAGPILVANFANHVKVGYKIVFSEQNLKDDRLFSPNADQREPLVQTPIQGKTSDGYEYVVMEIATADLNKHFEDKAKQEKEKYLGSLKRTQRDGDVLNIQEHDTRF